MENNQGRYFDCRDGDRGIVYHNGVEINYAIRGQTGPNGWVECLMKKTHNDELYDFLFDEEGMNLDTCVLEGDIRVAEIKEDVEKP